MHGAHEHDRSPQLRRQQGCIHAPTPALQIVRHVQNHQRRNLQTQHRCRQHQVPGEAGRIENQKNRIRLRQVGHLARKHIVSHLLVFRSGLEGINTRQVDQRHFTQQIDTRRSHMPLDSDAGIIRNPLPQSSQTIEQSGLPRIGWTD